MWRSRDSEFACFHVSRFCEQKTTTKSASGKVCKQRAPHMMRVETIQALLRDLLQSRSAGCYLFKAMTVVQAQQLRSTQSRSSIFNQRLRRLHPSKVPMVFTTKEAEPPLPVTSTASTRPAPVHKPNLSPRQTRAGGCIE